MRIACALATFAFLAVSSDAVCAQSPTIKVSANQKGPSFFTCGGTIASDLPVADALAISQCEADSGDGRNAASLLDAIQSQISFDTSGTTRISVIRAAIVSHPQAPVWDPFKIPSDVSSLPSTEACFPAGRFPAAGGEPVTTALRCLIKEDARAGLDVFLLFLARSDASNQATNPWTTLISQVTQVQQAAIRDAKPTFDAQGVLKQTAPTVYSCEATALIDMVMRNTHTAMGSVPPVDAYSNSLNSASLSALVPKIASCYLSRREYDSAIALYTAIAEAKTSSYSDADGEKKRATAGLAEAYRLSGNSLMARKYITQSPSSVAARAPHFQCAQTIRANIARAERKDFGRYPNEESLSGMIEYLMSTLDAQARIAACLLANNDASEAIRTIKAILQIKGMPANTNDASIEDEFARAYDTLAKAEYKLGAKMDARKHIAIAFRLNEALQNKIPDIPKDTELMAPAVVAAAKQRLAREYAEATSGMSSDERAVYRNNGSPDHIESYNGGSYREETWWYGSPTYTTGFTFRNGILVSTFNP